MAQFSVYRNLNAATKLRYPLLLDIQADLLRELATRVVVPLTSVKDYGNKPLRTLIPVCRILGKDYVVLTPQLAAISVKELGQEVANLAEMRDVFVASLDFLLSGI